jgi:hypothetical protein
MHNKETLLVDNFAKAKELQRKRHDKIINTLFENGIELEYYWVSNYILEIYIKTMEHYNTAMKIIINQCQEEACFLEESLSGYSGYLLVFNFMPVS